MTKVVAIIPARKGSKGLTGKNKLFLGGIPLWRHSLELALKCHSISKIIVTSNDSQIFLNEFNYKDVIFLKRDESLSGDKSTLVDVCLNAIDEIDENKEVSIILLQPTSPYRKILEVEAAIETYKNLNGESLISVRESSEHPYESIIKDGSNLIKHDSKRRQLYPKSFFITGSFYIDSYRNLLRRKSFHAENTFYFETNEPIAIDIDSEADFEIACALYELMKNKGYAFPFYN